MRTLLILAAALLLGACQPVDTAGLSDAMEEYLEAIHDKNPGLVLRHISQEDKWHFISYRASSRKIVSAPFYTFEETRAQFDKRGGLWSALFDGTDDYRYADRVAAHPLAAWEFDADGLTYRIPAKDGISYVTWRKENGNWVITAIGDSSP